MKPSFGRWPQPDFLARRQGRPPLAWLWAGTGALVLAAAVADLLDARAAVAAQQARLARAEQRVARVAAAAASAAKPAVNRDPLPDADAMGAAWRTVDRLRHPWGRLLADLEAETPDGLQWLLFDHDADSADLRAEGLAPEVDTALRLVDALAGRRGWSEVVLTRLEAADPHEANGAGRLWRFEIHAVIDAGALAASRAPAPG